MERARRTRVRSLVALLALATAGALAGCRLGSGSASQTLSPADRLDRAERQYEAAKRVAVEAVAEDALLVEQLARVDRRAVSAREQGRRALELDPGPEQDRLIEVAAFRLREAAHDMQVLVAAARRRHAAEAAPEAPAAGGP